MKLLVDANILLDVLQAREPYLKDSSLIWKLCETGEVQGYASALTFANLIYIMRKQLDAKGIHDVLNKMQMIFHIAALSEAELKQASEMEWKDFEDAIQCATAERIGADFIITRNVKDFLQSRKVSALTPAEFLERYF
ncbi:MAG: PIN domain-containing protein [Lachnospiraceae bacterium]|jgi:predicted nucleic acid-binding protein|nr:PIN domain-containing protein [Lachnospiraceae bacterium]MCH4031456.1 PIN domain-containing protein [Lachnospiraceae bacterium]MCH4071168.1 PIN domain-containing protein [Lachnospiraceae bacterium]MCH4108010.1 PIN domain-containing protein [Lachnospiraceae bacterium]MCI1302726.1 PIN domain-containing protein [Lachnospiraceae bacterium]